MSPLQKSLFFVWTFDWRFRFCVSLWSLGEHGCRLKLLHPSCQEGLKSFQRTPCTINSRVSCTWAFITGNPCTIKITAAKTEALYQWGFLIELSHDGSIFCLLSVDSMQWGPPRHWPEHALGFHRRFRGKGVLHKTKHCLLFKCMHSAFLFQWWYYLSMKNLVGKNHRYLASYFEYTHSKVDIF